MTFATIADLQNNQLVEEFKKEKKIPVIEIFGPTIQGEGPLAGGKTMFVRTGGCDYRCVKCDSLHAVEPASVKANAQRLTQDEIAAQLIAKMRLTGTRWVTLSGGNPCMWDFDSLIQALHREDFLVAVETQGTLAPEWLRRVDLIVVSPKSPGMKEKFEPDKYNKFLANLTGYPTVVALKIVIFSQQDIDFGLSVGALASSQKKIRSYMRYFSLGNPHPPYLGEDLKLHENVSRSIQLEHLMREYRLLIEDMTNDPRIDDWKFLPQLHVLAFGNEVGR